MPAGRFRSRALAGAGLNTPQALSTSAVPGHDVPPRVIRLLTSCCAAIVMMGCRSRRSASCWMFSESPFPRSCRTWWRADVASAKVVEALTLESRTLLAALASWSALAARRAHLRRQVRADRRRSIGQARPARRYRLWPPRCRRGSGSGGGRRASWERCGSGIAAWIAA